MWVRLQVQRKAIARIARGLNSWDEATVVPSGGVEDTRKAVRYMSMRQDALANMTPRSSSAAGGLRSGGGDGAAGGGIGADGSLSEFHDVVRSALLMQKAYRRFYMGLEVATLLPPPPLRSVAGPLSSRPFRSSTPVPCCSDRAPPPARARAKNDTRPRRCISTTTDDDGADGRQRRTTHPPAR